MKLPQLSLREMFWTILVAGILCGWWVDRTALVDTYNRDIRMLRETNGGLLEDHLRLQAEMYHPVVKP